MDNISLAELKNYIRYINQHSPCKLPLTGTKKELYQKVDAAMKLPPIIYEEPWKVIGRKYCPSKFQFTRRNVCKLACDFKLSPEVIKEFNGVLVSMCEEFVTPASLFLIYRVFDSLYFDGFLSETLKITFKVENKKSGVAGRCKRLGDSEFTISLNMKCFERIKDDTKQECGGLICTGKKSCIVNIFCHEMAHVIILISPEKLNKQGKREIHGKVFKQLVNSMFGHTGTTHRFGHKIE